MPDERAVMTYVSSYYHCFSGAQKVCFSAFGINPSRNGRESVCAQEAKIKKDIVDPHPKLFSFFDLSRKIQISLFVLSRRLCSRLHASICSVEINNDTHLINNDSMLIITSL